MAVVLVVALKIKDGTTAEFERVVTELSRQVLENEPGARMYQLCRSQTDPSSYRLVELYDDQAALTAHGQSAHYKAAAPAFAACLAEKPTIEKFDTVGARSH